jgi:hypothetical protein
MRLRFASIHSDLDPASGQALATRELPEMLAGRGVVPGRCQSGALSGCKRPPPKPVAGSGPSKERER